MTETPQLPQIIPVFPLTGSLLLPGNWLPLHIFEERYRNMVQDAMKGDRVIGMIQPLTPSQDNMLRQEDISGPEELSDPDEAADEEEGSHRLEAEREERPLAAVAEEADERPELYAVGCAGRLEECEELEGGRFAISLKGVSRFRICREVELERGYRRVEVDYEEFVGDLEETDEGETPEGVLDALQAFGEMYRFTFELERLRELTPMVLVNGLAMALPFGPAEKQALLEARPEDREGILLMLLKMGVNLEDALDPTIPVLN